MKNPSEKKVEERLKELLGTQSPAVLLQINEASKNNQLSLTEENIFRYILIKFALSRFCALHFVTENWTRAAHPSPFPPCGNRE